MLSVQCVHDVDNVYDVYELAVVNDVYGARKVRNIYDGCDVCLICGMRLRCVVCVV